MDKRLKTIIWSIIVVFIVLVVFGTVQFIILSSNN